MDLQAGFRVGEWDVFPLSGDIRSAAGSVHLEPKVMEVLVALAERAESVVLREELLEKIWGSRAAVSDEPLTRCIAQLRQGLGDSSRDPRYIQTVPKRGYRLLRPVEPRVAAGRSVSPSGKTDATRSASAAKLGTGANTDMPTRQAPSPVRSVARWRGVASILVLLLLFYGAYSVWRPAGEARPMEEAARLGIPSGVQSARCDLEATEAPERRISPVARENCETGLRELDRRGPDALYNAIVVLRNAVAEQPDYGSAIVNLARAMVLYPTYEVNWLASDCAVAPIVTQPRDCFEAALQLLENTTLYAAYIEKYVSGIRAYIATKQHRWAAATRFFDTAVAETGQDADMRQWYSQFLASVGDLDGALEQARAAYELNPQSGVILDRLVVALMWLDLDEEAIALSEQRDRDPDLLTHNPYPATQLVLDVRQENWPELKRRLAGQANLRQQDAGWIDDFILGLQDDAFLDDAVAAVELAIGSYWLDGQLAYGAWVYLEQADRAIDAALELLEHPESFNPEFLFARETNVLRNSPRFGELLRELGLRDYWVSGGLCPNVLDAGQRARYCQE